MGETLATALEREHQVIDEDIAAFDSRHTGSLVRAMAALRRHSTWRRSSCSRRCGRWAWWRPSS